VTVTQPSTRRAAEVGHQPAALKPRERSVRDERLRGGVHAARDRRAFLSTTPQGVARLLLDAAARPETGRVLEQAGCEVHIDAASELNRGQGGPTCLTRPVLRS
jgi:hypothetical protein